MAQILSITPDDVLAYVIFLEICFICAHTYAAISWIRYYDARRQRRQIWRPFQFQPLNWKPFNPGEITMTSKGFEPDDHARP